MLIGVMPLFGPGVGRPAAAAEVRRLIAPGLASDSAPVLLDCDPTNLTMPAFSFEDVRVTDAAGFGGQVFNGVIRNHCAQAVTALTASAATADVNGNHVGISFFHPSFGVIPAGGVSPFFVVVPPGAPVVTGMGFAVPRYTLVSAAVPDLRVTPVAVSATGGGAVVGFTVVNSGTAVAAIPRIAGSLLGPGCKQPDVIQYLQDAAPIAPGATVTGSLTIPDGCGGIPQLWAGADMPEAAAQPAGFSLRAATVTYNGTTLRLVAKLCNNTAANVDNVPLSARFNGPAGSTTLSFTGVGFFPARACAPLIAAVPNAPAGLTFDALTGTGSAQVTAASVAGGIGLMDPEEQLWRFEGPFGDQQPFWWWLYRSIDRSGGPNSLNPPAPDSPSPPTGFANADGISAGGTTAQADADAFVLVSIVYNQNAAPIAGSQYSIIASATDAGGNSTAAIVIAEAPGLPPLGWGIAATPLTDASVVGPPGTTFFLDAQGFVP
jgi:hypothetical protein